MIKLIVWDLDGVLWEDSLSEDNQTGTINNKALEFIKQSESVGVAHSICSKNNFDQAKQTLEELGVWDLFVFPTIDYSPKGPAVKRVIESFQLREINVLFVDDNEINLNEVKYFCPDINVSTDTSFIDTFDMPTGKSRTDQYKILEAKSFDKDNADFLKDSQIKISICNWNNSILFYDRIFELVNRSNQLNFTNTRFNDLSNAPMPYSEFQNRKNYTVFVWDKYGYYGLVGYFATNEDVYDKIDYFVFSCRILNMGIEQYCAKHIAEHFPGCAFDIELSEKDTSYIEYIDYEIAKSVIYEKEEMLFSSVDPKIKLYAGCLGLPIWATCKYNYMIDVAPFQYHVRNIDTTFDPDLIVLSVMNEMNGVGNTTGYKQLVNAFIKQEKNFLLIFPDKLASLSPTINKDQQIYDIWLEASNAPNVDIVKLPVKGDHDHSHFDRYTLSLAGDYICDWAKNKLSLL